MKRTDLLIIFILVFCLTVGLGLFFLSGKSRVTHFETNSESSMILKSMEAGPLQVNCYIIGNKETKEAMVVDPGGDAQRIYDYLQSEGLTCTMIVNTHTHWDHIGGNAELKKLTNAKIITHEDEAPMLEHASTQGSMFGIKIDNSPGADETVKHGDILKLGNIEFKIVELPGHSPCGIGLVFSGNDKNYAIVGDALFSGSIGRTDFPGGNMELLLDKIRENIFTLPGDTMVLPGHGPSTTVEREKRFNPFF